METTSFTVIYVTLTVTDTRQPTLKARQGLKGDQRKPERVPGALSTPHQLAHLQGQGAHPLRGSLNVRKCFLNAMPTHGSEVGVAGKKAEYVQGGVPPLPAPALTRAVWGTVECWAASLAPPTRHQL